MSNFRQILTVISTVTAVTLSGCSYVQSLFPDKEKDYQYTTEIPALILPAGLERTSGLNDTAFKTVELTPNAATEISAPTLNGADNAAPVAPEVVNADGVAAKETSPAATPPTIHVEQIKTAEGITQLQLAAPFDSAWRSVDKALGRQAIEVSQRNKDTGLFYIHYDADEQQLEDDSFLHEVTFIFSGFGGDDKAYLLKLVSDNTQHTTVTVLDAEQKPLSDAASLTLLTVLQKTIETNSAVK